MATPSDRAPALEIPARPRPEWGQDQAVQYEVAREAITALMAFRSQWIFDEEAKSSPDLAVIERWRSERAAFSAELSGLHVRDDQAVARISQQYGAEIQRLDALESQREPR